MTVKRKKFLASLLIFASACTLAASAVATYAGFSARKYVNRDVGSLGSINNTHTIYFNANKWEKDSPVYYMKRYKSGYETTKLLWVPVKRVVTPTIGGVNYIFSIFQYDTSNTELNMIKFYRLNPKGSHLPESLASMSTDPTASIWPGEPDNDNKTFWNVSKAITYSSTYSYYCIESFDQSQAGSCTKAELSYSNETWTGPSNSVNA